jgi:hypothetical protein
VSASEAFAAGFLYFLVVVCLAAPGAVMLVLSGLRGGARPRIEHG